MDPRSLNRDLGPRYDKTKSSDTNVASLSSEISTTPMQKKKSTTSYFVETDRESNNNKIHDQRGVMNPKFLGPRPSCNPLIRYTQCTLNVRCRSETFKKP